MKMSNYPLISVIIPTYGRAEMLGRAIESILKQTYSNIEVVVVNDNSKESTHYLATLAALRPYERDSRVKVISDGENVGGSLARNKGIKASSGEYISFLDDDDYYYRDKVEKQFADIVLQQSDVSVCGMDREINGEILSSKDGDAIVGDLPSFIVRGRAFTPMIFLKKEVAEDVGGFTKAAQFQDHIFMIKILAKGFCVSTIKDRLFVHVVHDGERITKKNINLINYNVRREFENKHLHILSSSQRKQYNFNYYLINARFYRDTKNFKEFILNMLFSSKNITNIYSFGEFFRVLLSYIIKWYYL